MITYIYQIPFDLIDQFQVSESRRLKQLDSKDNILLEIQRLKDQLNVESLDLELAKLKKKQELQLKKKSVTPIRQKEPRRMYTSPSHVEPPKAPITPKVVKKQEVTLIKQGTKIKYPIAVTVKKDYKSPNRTKPRFPEPIQKVEVPNKVHDRMNDFLKESNTILIVENNHQSRRSKNMSISLSSGQGLPGQSHSSASPQLKFNYDRRRQVEEEERSPIVDQPLR